MRRRTAVVGCLVVVLTVFFAPIVPLQQVNIGADGQVIYPIGLCHGPLLGCEQMMGTSIKRFASPSSALFGTGGVFYQTQDWLTCSGTTVECNPPVDQGYLLTSNNSDIAQYLR